jgi:hypothetical protein
MTDSWETDNIPSLRGKIIKWVVLILIILIIAPLTLLLIGCIYESITSQSDPERYPSPGEMVDIGGYRLHLVCEGERQVGQPLVIIEAGSGSSSPDWALVLPEIAQFARVCTYDRAGLGWSETGPPPRSSMTYASEMEAVLERSGEEPSYLLVAHSLGGHTVRIYTDEHPDNVVGMILIDARPPSGNIPT